MLRRYQYAIILNNVHVVKFILFSWTGSLFESLSSNYIYCPNQYFDVCVPNCSRGAVRLVGHVLFKTLGWLDKNGQPIYREDGKVMKSELYFRPSIDKVLEG